VPIHILDETRGNPSIPAGGVFTCKEFRRYASLPVICIRMESALSSIISIRPGLLP
jgi:hypothetical protein